MATAKVARPALPPPPRSPPPRSPPAGGPGPEGFPLMPPMPSEESFHVSGPQGYTLLEKAIDDYRPIRVVVIGAGFSGVTTLIRLRQRIKNASIVCYEKMNGIGGTWCANKYPGLACDIPAHSYQLTFAPNPSWSAFYAPGPEIHDYIEGVVDKWKIRPYIKLEHEVIKAAWCEKQGKWNIQVKDLTTSQVINDVADVVIAGMGGLSRWKWPAIPNLDKYQGMLLHSANWDSDLGIRGPNDKGSSSRAEDPIQRKYKGKKVAVIGCGSSAIQIVPAIQPLVKHLVNFVRGKTWIATPFASQYVLERQPDGSNHTFTDEEKREWEENPEAYFKFRKYLDSEMNSAHGVTLLGNPIQHGASFGFKMMMQGKLAKKPWIAEHLVPDYPVSCRRLTPGPGYLEALVEDNVDFVPTGVKSFTPRGLETIDGKTYEFDVIICATGFDTSFKPRFSIIGKEGLDLRDAYDPHPKTYMTMLNAGFPNWVNTMGPNSAIGSGSILTMIEKEADYAVAFVKKLQKERYKSIEVKQEAVDDFDAYLETYFPRTVYGAKCRSWYKAGKEEGRVVGVWPGSCLHSLFALSEPRWEDFNYELLDSDIQAQGGAKGGKLGKGNRFYYLGNGWTHAEKTGQGDRSWYLNNVDVPPIPEDDE